MMSIRSAATSAKTALMQRRNQPATRPYLATAVGIGCALALYFGAGEKFVSLAWDPHEVNCLPELHLAFLVHKRPGNIKAGDYLFWKAGGYLSYVKEPYILKRVAGVPGDQVDVRGGVVRINGKVVASGLENAVIYKTTPDALQRTERIPSGSYFVIGTAKYSNDSRYWGYLTDAKILGKAYRVY